MRHRIQNLSKLWTVKGLGEKSRNLHWLHQHGWKIPTTHVIPFEVYQEYQKRGISVLSDLHQPLSEIIDPHKSYAIRSSANLEDTLQNSFAGQFKTILNVRGVVAIIHSVHLVMEASKAPSLVAYAHHAGQDIKSLQLAVIIQQMIEPVVSGVAFSKNPLTGLSEVIVEAVRGSGEQIVQEGKTPARWVFQWGNWISQPVEVSIPEILIQQIVAQTSQISQKYGSPVDLEWVYDGEDLYWVQLRPITRLEQVNIYSCRISREVFPGVIKPLVWSVNIPLVNNAWIKLFSELIGPNTLQPEELARSFAYRAYFNMGVIGQIFILLGFPRESLELLLGIQRGDNRPSFRPSFRTIRLLPRMLWFLVRRLTLPNQVLRSIPDIHRDLSALTGIPVTDPDEAGLLDHIQKLFSVNQRTAYFNILVPLVMSLFNNFLRRLLVRVGVDYTNFDLTKNLSQLDEYNPNNQLQSLADQFNKLSEANRSRISSCTYSEFCALSDLTDFKWQVSEFIRRFGYLSDSGNDFSSVPWRETPDLILQMILNEAKNQRGNSNRAWQSLKWMHDQSGSDQHECKQEKSNWQTISINRFQRLILHPIYQIARQFRLYREMVSSTYTYGYGLFRIYFLELGRRLAARGELDYPEDIFFLEWGEIREFVHQLSPRNEISARMRVKQRKAEMEACKDKVLPETIFGDELPPFSASTQFARILTGVPSSRGYYRGPVKVIRSVAEFDKMDSGDVLVIPYSDVSWAPLFSRAGAVVAESGGILSHSSIVAREYQIPAVVSVSGVMRLRDHIPVTVDGYRGEIILHTTSDEDPNS